ncbi:antitoxin [Candidatus Acetothermia bacterium]|nr:MAG: antitoxin [Candidatus Acetothermia bacterium]
MKVADRIEVDPNICHGKPRIAGTRIPVETILGLLADGLTPKEIIAKCYPDLPEEGILACIRYAKQLVEEEEVHAVPEV